MNNTIGNANRPVNESKVKNKDRQEPASAKNRVVQGGAKESEAVSNEARAVKSGGTRIKDGEVESLLKKITGNMNDIAANIDNIFTIKPANVFALLKEN